MYKYGIHSDLARDVISLLEKGKHYILYEEDDHDCHIERYQVMKNDYLKSGDYYEISFSSYDYLESVLMHEFEKLIAQYNYPTILVVGVGNAILTCDAIGNRTYEKIQVTHYLDDSVKLNECLYDILAFAPGVPYQTGIEGVDVIESIVRKENVDLVIAIDAICTSDYDKIGHVIQINNVGIMPGGGMGNKKKAYSEENLHCPVLAVGIPTVIYASSIMGDFFHIIKSYFAESMNEGSLLKIGKRERYRGTLSQRVASLLLGELGVLEEHKLLDLLKEILDPIDCNYIFTDKAIDEVVEKLSEIIAQAINHLRYK